MPEDNPPKKSAKVRYLTLRVCATCQHMVFDGHGAWDCKINRKCPGGDTGDKEEYFMTCRLWKQ